jgi:hypothetical protein
MENRIRKSINSIRIIRKIINSIRKNYKYIKYYDSSKRKKFESETPTRNVLCTHAPPYPLGHDNYRNRPTNVNDAIERIILCRPCLQLLNIETVLTGNFLRGFFSPHKVWNESVRTRSYSPLVWTIYILTWHIKKTTLLHYCDIIFHYITITNSAQNTKSCVPVITGLPWLCAFYMYHSNLKSLTPSKYFATADFPPTLQR